MDLERRFEDIRNFLGQHIQLVQSEILNHYPHELPSPYDGWCRQLSKLSKNNLIDIENGKSFESIHGELRNYYESIKELSQLPEVNVKSAAIPKRLEVGMTHKKRHETSIIKGFLAREDLSKIIDVGSGKGHMSKVLLYDTDGSSECIDCDPKLQSSGAQLIKKQTPELATKISFREEFFTKDSVIKDRSSLILGLHCCGDLSVELIRSHITSCEKLLNFGCCYHKSKEFNLSGLALSSPIPFSFHALNLATRSNRTLNNTSFDRRQSVKLYRYILHMILKDELNEEFKTLGNAHHSEYYSDFTAYCKKYAPQTKKLDVDSLHKKYLKSDRLKDYLVAEVIRSPLGRLVELYIILDRALFLKENGHDVKVCSFFDPELSPRNIGIFSCKL